MPALDVEDVAELPPWAEVPGSAVIVQPQKTVSGVKTQDAMVSYVIERPDSSVEESDIFGVGLEKIADIL